MVLVRKTDRPLLQTAARQHSRRLARPAPASRRRLSKLPAASALVAAGGAAAYLLDPRQGRGRRARLGDEVRATLRRQRRETMRSVRYAERRLEGAVAKARGAGRFTPAGDRAVADKLKEVLAAADVDTSDVTVDVVEGVATLRGQVGTPEQIRDLERLCADVNGVERVESLLHLPGTDAPNKAASRRVDQSGPGSVVGHGA